MIVGESLIGVALAALVVFSHNATPLALVGEGFSTAALWIGGIAFTAVISAMYMWISRLARREVV
jgi:Zn-dependent protease with chaperone function